MNTSLADAAKAIAKDSAVLVFTGAGVSVESGIPSFRGDGGLWEKYDPSFIEIDHFYRNPEFCWAQIREIFYQHWGKAKPNAGHYAVAAMQKHGWVHTIVTQNIDALHQRAGAADVIEFHGTLDQLVCTECGFRAYPTEKLLSPRVPFCPDCGALLKPDFVFFGEGIPEPAQSGAFEAVKHVSAVITAGTSGEVMPACYIPCEAKKHGAVIIEVNPCETAFTRNHTTDIFLQGKSGVILPRLLKEAEKLL